MSIILSTLIKRIKAAMCCVLKEIVFPPQIVLFGGFLEAQRAKSIQNFKNNDFFLSFLSHNPFVTL